jgi:methionyl-tRNA formyltransferase
MDLCYFVAIKYFETRRIMRFISLNKISISSPEFRFDTDSQEFLEFLSSENFDLLVLGQNMILPKKVLDVGRERFVNVHPARLPFYRGYAEPAHAILAGKLDDVGYSLHLVSPQMDQGGLIEFAQVDLQEFDSLNSSLVRVRIRGYDQLFRRVANEGVKNFLNSAKPQNQDEARTVEILSYRKRLALDLKIFLRAIKWFRVGKSSNNFLNEK